MKAQWPLPHPAALMLIGAATGAIYTLYLFPFDFLAGTSAFWQGPPISDLATEIAGIRYYLGDAWSFPLFRTLKIGAPEGTSIIYMDTLPLFAVIAKLLRNAIGTNCVYFGIWIALCYILQAVSAVVLIMAVGVRSYTASVAGAVIALSAPPFLFRLFHPTLCAHFLVLLALALYFIAIRTGSPRRVWPWFLFLAWLSLWVQAYLFVMVVVVFFATGIQVAVASRKYRVGACLAMVFCVVGALGIMWGSGYFWGRSEVRISELGTPEWFGRLSMNLLSPVIPQWSELFPAAGRLLGPTEGPYKAVGVIDATGGQYEGYNYLGAGTLILAGIGLALDLKKLGLRARRYWGLVGALLLLTALAVTHRVYLGGSKVVLFERVPLILDDVRSSGRFFWPVGYAVMGYAIAAVVRHCRRPVALALLLLMAATQAADAASIRRWIYAFTGQGYPARYFTPRTLWIDLIRDHQAVSIFPTYACAAEDKAWPLIAEIVFYASESLTPVNTAAIDRVSNLDCTAEAKSLRQMTVEEGTLVVLLGRRDMDEFAAGHPDYRQTCRSFERGWACSRHWPRIEAMGWSRIFNQL